MSGRRLATQRSARWAFMERFVVPNFDTDDEDYLQRHLAYTALGDLARPDDLGEAIAYFLEPQSDAVTGETLRVAAGVR